MKRLNSIVKVLKAVSDEGKDNPLALIKSEKVNYNEKYNRNLYGMSERIHSKFHKEDQRLNDHPRDIIVTLSDGKKVKCLVCISDGYRHIDTGDVVRYADSKGYVFEVLPFDLYYQWEDQSTILLYKKGQ